MASNFCFHFYPTQWSQCLPSDSLESSWICGSLYAHRHCSQFKPFSFLVWSVSTIAWLLSLSPLIPFPCPLHLSFILSPMSFLKHTSVYNALWLKAHQCFFIADKIKFLIPEDSDHHLLHETSWPPNSLDYSLLWSSYTTIYCLIYVSLVYKYASLHWTVNFLRKGLISNSSLNLQHPMQCLVHYKNLIITANIYWAVTECQILF